MINSVEIETDPYPGLRAFQPDEAHLFFGRDEQIDKLLERLEYSHFVAVVGPSGCGKSSLIKAGLIPALKTGFFLNGGANWQILGMRPGDQPYYNLAKVLFKSFGKETSLDCIKAELKRSPKGLIEVIKSENLKKQENILLVVDQFEELFRYKQNNNIDEVTAFIALLIASVNKQDVSIHIVITMRSDFLGDCSLFLGLPEILNNNQFLTPRLSREQTKEAIEGPALVCGGNLEPFLVNTLLNDIGVDHDQLPLLQHALMRMWTSAKKTDAGSISSNNNSTLDNFSSGHTTDYTLTAEEYNKIGKLNNALSEHANNIFDKKLNSDQKMIAEVLFKRLSERNTEQKDIRRPSTVQDIANVAKVSAEEVIEVADFFRSPDNSFLMPPPDTDLTPQSYLDITHESLIRQWDKMKKWIAKEYADTTLFKRLVADSDEYINGKGGLLTGMALENALLWKKQDNVNKSWSSRYLNNNDQDKYEQVEKYIEDSRIQAKMLLEDNNRKEIKSKIYKKVLIGTFMLLLCSIAVFGFIYQQAKLNSAVDKAISDSTMKKNLLEKNEALARNFDWEKQSNIQKMKIFDIERRRKEAKKNTEIESAKRLESEKEQKKYKLLYEKYASISEELTTKNNKYDSLLTRRTSDLVDLKIAGTLFFKSDKINITTKEKSKQLLLSSYETEKYDSILNSFNTIALALDTAAIEPVAAIRMAKRIFEIDSNEVVKELALEILNKNIFYNQKIAPTDKTSINSDFFMLFNDKTQFVFNDNMEIIRGNLTSTNDNVVISNVRPYKIDTKIDYGKQNTWSADTVSAYRLDNISSLIATGDNKILTIEKNKLYEWNNNKKTAIAILPGNDKTYYKLSSNGKILFTYNIDGTENRAALWETDKLKLNKRIPISIGGPNIKIYSVAFSPDNKTIAIGSDNVTTLWNTRGMVIDNLIGQNENVAGQNRSWSIKNLSENYYTDPTTCLNFSHDGQLIALATAGGKLKIWDVPNKIFTDSVDLKDEFKLKAGVNSIDWIALSDDKMKILVSSKYSNKIVFYNRDNNVQNKIKRLVYSVNSNSSFKVISSDFLDNNTIISFDNLGFMYQWKINAVFNNMNEALDHVYFPDEVIGQKIKKDSINYEDVLNGDDSGRLVAAASHFSNQSYSEYYYNYDKSIDFSIKAKELYKKLIQISVGEQKKIYLRKIISLNLKLNSLESFNVSPKYNLIVERLKENSNILENELKEDIQNSSIKEQLSSCYWNLSWFQLFNKEFDSVILSAERGFELYPRNNGIKTNLALGYLLSKRFSEATAVYTENKGKLYSNNFKRFTDAFLQDFKDLEDAGIISPNEQEIYKEVTRIREMLTHK